MSLMQSESLNNNSIKGSLTTNPDLFSNESWNLLLDSQDAARRWRHGHLDVEHLLHVLFSERTYKKKFIDSLSINQAVFIDRLEGFLADQPLARGDQLIIGDDLEDLLENADHFRSSWGSQLIEISHMLLALGKDQRIGAQLLEETGLPSEKLEVELQRSPIRKSDNSEQPTKQYKAFNSDSSSFRSKQISNDALSSSNSLVSPEVKPPITNDDLELQKEPQALDAYGRDLTAAAKSGELDPVIGREAEIRNLIKVLSRKGKNNPVLIGAPGVGKTAIAELLAQRIVNDEVPEALKGLRLIALDLGALIAGAKFRGQFEERFRAVLAESSDPDAGVVLFIDELHSVISTDRTNADAANLLKPFLAKGDIRCIGATTPENYRRTVEKDPALNRRFQQVLIKEPNLDMSIEILRGLKERYELHHGVKISDEAITTANRLADRYISDRCLPDKAIDLIDEASAQLKIEATSKPQIIEETEAKLKKIDLKLLSTNQSTEKDNRHLQKDRDITARRLNELNKCWDKELSQLRALRDLLQDEEELQKAIAYSESIGDLEEAARLQYDQLRNVQKHREDIENSIFEAQSSGKALLKDQVEAEDIADVVARWTGIPVQRVLAGERQKLLNLEKELGERVIGQSKAVQAVSAAIRRARAGMKDPRRPVGSFLFLGPTGVGKTELAKTLAASLFDDEEALVRLDMSEFMERNAVARLLGAPPGYVGYEEGGQLTEAVRHRPYAVLLLDELEKAHPDVFNVLLQVLDDGRLTDSQGRTIDFRHTVIVMTTNLASRAILDKAKLSQEKEQKEEELEEKLAQKIDQALNQRFRPEFLNRIDEVIRFRPLQPKDLQQIIKLYLEELSNLLKEQKLELRVDQSTIERLALQGYEPEYGARPLRRVLRRKLENPLATRMLQEEFKDVSTIRVSTADNELDSLMFFGEN